MFPFGISSCKLAIIFSCAILLKYFASGSNDVNDTLSPREFFDLIVKKYGWRRQLEVVTLEDGSRVNVTDVIVAGRDGTIVVRVAAIKLGTHSSAKLMLPEKLTPDAIDTSQWKIDHSYIRRNSYYHSMIESIFQSKSIKMSRDTYAKVLSIGLGGGTLDGFLHHVFPLMDITVVDISPQIVNMARKWFGLKEDDHHRVEIADGVKFLAEKAKMGWIYDVILLDACLTEQTQGILCPVESFLEDTVIANIAQSVHKEGIFVSNALSMTMSRDDLYKYLTKRFLSHFAHCERRDVRASANQVIYCTHYTPVENHRIDLYKFLNETML
ncbi:hypothetical protein RB195_008483 [Necator americanus]|uniref:Methyltransferase domain protein n=1 Tax=Necator americanus TaxID=51031 RepID=A0ABR1CQ48_NECAM